MAAVGNFAVLVGVMVVLSSCGSGAGKAPAGPQGSQTGTLAGLHYTPSLTATVAAAHKQYLSDPLTFQPLPDGGLTETSTAVIGSRVARFYPAAVESLLSRAAQEQLTTQDIPEETDGRWAKDWTMDELKTMPEGRPIPFATILPLLPGTTTGTGDMKKSNGIMAGPLYGLFPFQGNFNRFYRTRFQGQEGYVFGADLYGLGQTALQNQIASELYLTRGRPAAFHAVTGQNALAPDVAQRLIDSKLAFQSTVYQKDYSLSSESPDDLVACYKYLAGSRDSHNYQTVFLTTDLAAHAQHLVFDRILQYEEEVYFFPRLQELVGGLLESAEKWKKDNPRADPWFSDLGVHYLQVAEALLRLAPKRWDEADQYGHFTVKYTDVDPGSVLGDYPPAVVHDLELMNKAQGFAISSVLSKDEKNQYREDFSQYKPRGHYTKNGVLKAYFKAMMWFGRINFLIAESGVEPLPAGGGSSADSTALTLAMEPTALLFNDFVLKDAELYQKWADLFDPITALIGLSDDLSFEEVMPLWKDQNVADVASWMAKKENLLAFMKKAHQKLRPPAISGNSVFSGPSEGSDHAPPMGWRLFGQRFTWDSYVHEQVSPPRLMSRDMVRGLDVMAAFGSRTADALLASSDYRTMEGLQARLRTAAKIFAGWTDAYWNTTFYNQTLFTIRAQALFEPGTGFYFTESPAWGLKAMISSHGTWAELRHDTILYVKQVYAERAGGGDFDPTFRTEEVPRPVHYVEPNLPFWQGVAKAARGLASILDRFQILDDEGRTALQGLVNLYAKASAIVEKEIADQPVAREDLDWIPSFAGELVPLVMVHNKTGSI